MQINKIRQLGRYLASMRNALFPNSPSGQTLQITIFEHGNNLMYSLASKEFTKGAAFAINSVQVGPGVEQGGDHVGLGRLVAGGRVEGVVVFVVKGLDVGPALQQEGYDLGRGKLTDGVAAHG